jgi:hypothetical protein
MWCEGVVWIHLPQSMDHRTRTVGTHKGGEFVEDLSDCTVTKNLEKIVILHSFCTVYSEDSTKKCNSDH